MGWEGEEGISILCEEAMTDDALIGVPRRLIVTHINGNGLDYLILAASQRVGRGGSGGAEGLGIGWKKDKRSCR